MSFFVANKASISLLPCSPLFLEISPFWFWGGLVKRSCSKFLESPKFGFQGLACVAFSPCFQIGSFTSLIKTSISIEILSNNLPFVTKIFQGKEYYLFYLPYRKSQNWTKFVMNTNFCCFRQRFRKWTQNVCLRLTSTPRVKNNCIILSKCLSRSFRLYE